MSVFSSLRTGVLTPKNVFQPQVRNGGGYSAAIRPSRWNYDKFKDELHFYFMLGAIPCGLGILLANMMGGNTELRAIPDNYTPKEWEYFPNPITRSVTGNMTSLASSFDANFTTHLGIFERSSEKTRLDYIKVLRPIEY